MGSFTGITTGEMRECGRVEGEYPVGDRGTVFKAVENHTILTTAFLKLL